MPLSIRDENVGKLAEKLVGIGYAENKTAAIRLALTRELDRSTKAIPLTERVAAIQASVANLGSVDKGFDQKAFADDMWENS